ncbi:SgrR family transcriptional regulator [Bacillus sp. P14.5]|uniref:SgrR family transcriptional regulator n=1 Tax=Bacillus sp. P14.5 TaxID=1983400 RepID=UPI000DE84B7E|nr:SgrR family transcriptional regulator [Bacillus sp. P14.5]
MISLEHYVRLYLAQGKQIHRKLEISLSSISEVLFCTTRNSKLTIHKWEREGWAKWSPGRGRGNKSTLTFLEDPVHLLMGEGRRLVKKGKLEAAQDLIGVYGREFPGLEEDFADWLETLFGYHAESESRDVLRLKYGKQPFSPLDPTLASLRSECHILKHVCDRLVSYNEEKNQFEPRLAFHWEHNESGDQWIFYIRKGVKFHDGSRLTTRDIQHTFERFLQTEENPYRWMLQDLNETVILGEHAIKLQLNKPNHLLLHLLSDEHLSVVRKNEQKEVYLDTLIGTGPFRLVRNDGTKLILEANEHYFRERPFLDSVEFWNVPEEREDRAPAKTEMDFGYYRGNEKEVGTRKRVARIEKNVQFLSLNGRKNGPLKDPLLRSALKAIADPSALVAELGEFRKESAASFLEYKENQREVEITDHLLKSTYNGEELLLYTFQDRDHVEDAAWLKERCKKYGISIKNVFLPAEELLRSDTMSEADIIHDSATITDQEELSFLQLVLAETSPIWHHFSDEFREELLAGIDQLKSLSSREKRLKRLLIIEEKLLRSCQVLPLYKNLSELESDESIQQALINSQGWIDFYRIWFKRK